MALSISNENKNSLGITNEARTGTDVTWDEAIMTWDESNPSTWDSVRTPITKESKNSLSISNQSKN